MKIFFWAIFGILVTSRLYWFYYYIYLSRVSKDPWGVIWSRLTARTGGRDQSEDRLMQRHENALSLSGRQLDTSILGGTIALAAWTVLYIGDASSHRFSGPSLDLLFLSGLTLILGPMIGRRDGGHLTYMIRESSIYIGFGSMVLALASMADDLGGDQVRALAVVAAVLLICREIMDVRDQLGNLDMAFPRGPDPSLKVAPGIGASFTADASASIPRVAPIESYKFDFGDGHRAGPSSNPRASHRYAYAGEYRVKLTVEDTKGRESEKTQVVTVPASAVISYRGRISHRGHWDATNERVVMHITKASEPGSTLLVSVVDSGITGEVKVADSRDNEYIVLAVEQNRSHRTLIFAAIKSTQALGVTDTITLHIQNAGDCSVTVDEFRGIGARTSPFTTVTRPVGGDALTSPVVTTGSGLLFTAVGTSGGAAVTFSGDWIDLGAVPTSASAAQHIACAYQIVTDTGLYTPTGTTTAEWTAALVTFQ